MCVVVVVVGGTIQTRHTEIDDVPGPEIPGVAEEPQPELGDLGRDCQGTEGMGQTFSCANKSDRFAKIAMWVRHPPRREREREVIEKETLAHLKDGGILDGIVRAPILGPDRR